MKTPFLLLFTMALLNCQQGKQNPGERGNNFQTKDAAVQQALADLPQLVGNRLARYGLRSAEDVKTLQRGSELPVSFVSFDQISRATDVSVLTQAKPTTFVVPLLRQNQVVTSIAVASVTPTKWIIESVNNQKYVTALRTDSTIREVVEFPGLELLFGLRRDAQGTATYQLIGRAGADRLFKRGATYSATELFPLLKSYADQLRRQFGDALQKGEIER